MGIKDWIELISAILGGLGFLALGFGYAWGQVTQGRNQNQLDNNSIYKERIEALELKAKTQNDDIKKLTEEVQDLHKAIDERDKKFAQAILNLQGKDPDMVEFITTMKGYVEANLPLLETIKVKVIPTVERLDKYLDKQII